MLTDTASVTHNSPKLLLTNVLPDNTNSLIGPQTNMPLATLGEYYMHIHEDPSLNLGDN